MLYVPKGTMLDYSDPARLNAALDQLEKRARRGAIWLKIDPDVAIGTGIPGTPDAVVDSIGEQVVSTLRQRGWHFSDSQVQYRNTIVLDLTTSEDDLLKRINQGTRYKVRYGPKHGVTVRSGSTDDLALLYKLYAETGARDHFLTRPLAYYEDEWGALMRAGLAHPLIAEYEGVALAHVILFRFGKTCWYFYGASSSEHRNLMPTYLLQWEAMRWAKANGCTRYDLWGAPNTFDEFDDVGGVSLQRRLRRCRDSHHWRVGLYALSAARSAVLASRAAPVKCIEAGAAWLVEFCLTPHETSHSSAAHWRTARDRRASPHLAPTRNPGAQRYQPCFHWYRAHGHRFCGKKYVGKSPRAA